LLHEVSYYSKARPGFGARFKDAVKTATARALRTPEAGSPAANNCRKFRVKGFPFNVVYRANETEVLVVAIAPDNKQPEYWLQRTR
jgi:plasmid stabilization system protein ParE